MAHIRQDEHSVAELMEALSIDLNDNGEAIWHRAVSQYESHMQRGDLASLDQAIKIARLSLTFVSRGYAFKAARVNNIGLMLERRYELTQSLPDLQAAILETQQAVELTPRGNPDREQWLNNLGSQLELRYERTRDLSDLEASITTALDVINSTSLPENDPARAVWYNSLVTKLTLKYEQTQEQSDLDLAITTAQEAVQLTPRNHPERGGRLTNLGTQLERRYERTHDVADLNLAIAVSQEAVDICPRNHRNRGPCLNNLANKLQMRHELTGSLDHLNAAIRAAENVLEEGHSNPVHWLTNLVTLLKSRYELAKDVSDLDAAIEGTRRVIELTPENDARRASRLSLLVNLGNLSGERYEQTGEIAALGTAIEAAQTVVNQTPRGHPDRASRLSNLATELHSRYQRTRAMVDLNLAITVAQEAANLTPEDHPDRAGKLSNLGSQLQTRYLRTGEGADLRDAISALHRAVNLTPENHPDRPRLLNNFGNQLSAFYTRTASEDHLNAAITVAQQSVDSTPLLHPDLAGRLNNLASNLDSRYEGTQLQPDLEAAIEVQMRAVYATSETHPDRALYLSSLGILLEKRHSITQTPADLELATLYLEESWNCTTAIPTHRISAGSRVLKHLFLLNQRPAAAEMARGLVDLLPTVNAKFLDRSDRQHIIATFAGVAADVCAVLLEVQGAEVALRYLEKGRAVILGGLIDDSSDLSRLKKEHPGLAGRFESYREILNSRVEASGDESVRLVSIETRRNAGIELDRCIKSIQMLPGFEHFMAPLTSEMMQDAAADGTIIIVNVSELRSDAIIVSPTSIRSMRLPQLSAPDAKAWLSKDWKWKRRDERGAKNKEYLEYLSWLWDTAVKEILDHIGVVSIEEDNLPRIWWIGTGLASSMPFHAAGSHSPISIANSFSRAISSYTPSIKALVFSQTRAASTSTTTTTTKQRLLMTTMPTTPGHPKLSLPGVAAERDAVLNTLTHHVTVTEANEVAKTTQELKRCSVAHFACHGRTNPIDPSQSGLILQAPNPSSGHLEAAHLTVREISEARLPHAQLAYLSACSTAENRVTQLADEVIHVVSGFQVAGFPHTVGCLWLSDDKVCVDIARGFYGSLVREEDDRGGLRLGSRDIAVALRRSVLAVREKQRKMPLNWAQYVHYGA